MQASRPDRLQGRQIGKAMHAGRKTGGRAVRLAGTKDRRECRDNRMVVGRTG